VMCHLTGDGGDTLFLSPPIYLADLARRGRLLRMVMDAQGWARLRRVSPWPLLVNAITGDTRHLKMRGNAPKWLTHRAVDQVLARGQAADPFGLDHADRDLLARARFTARTAHTEGQLADSVGVAMHNPYLDARVLDTVLAVPGWQRSSPFQYKPMLAAATAGLLPETVHTRAAKGVFGGDHHRGLRNNLDDVLSLADGHLAARGLINPDRVRDEIRRAAAGVDVVWGRLEPLLAVEAWLRALDTAPPLRWSASGRQASPA
jgi:asparagine synthase (glutamine-hydrolysing)